MEKQTLSKSEILRKLFEQYNLIFDKNNPKSKDNDIFIHNHFTIITRSGIEKIQKAANIHIKYEIFYVSENAVFVKAVGHRLNPDGTIKDSIETLASASDRTSTSAYFPEMAEKRAMSRVVLKLAGLYEYGVFGADESDEWKEEAKRIQSTGNTRAQYKGE